MTETIQQRVARGAAWLDEVRPGWRDQIRLGELNLSRSDLCVLGQVFHGEQEQSHGFYIGISVMARESAGSINDLGFNANVPDMPDCPERHNITNAETLALVAEWRRVIHASRVPAETRSEVPA